jgi:hypothetical protein
MPLCARGGNRLLAFAPILIVLGGGCTTASAGTFYVQGIYQQPCNVLGGLICVPTGIINVPQAPSFSLDNDQHVQNHYQPDSGTDIFVSLDDHLIVNAGFVNGSTGIFHAFGATTATYTANLIGGFGLFPTGVAGGQNLLQLTAFDTVHFGSATLSPGTAISLQLTEILDSTITGPCEANAPASAQFNVLSHFMPVLFHTNCGNGSDHMSSTTVFASTVGGSIGIDYDFRITSTAGVACCASGPGIASDAHTVDASNTGAFFITVLTPGVTLTSDSGYNYQAANVPEPATLALLCAGCLMLCASRFRSGSR